MFLKNPQKTFLARNMRKTPTEAESIAWETIRSNKHRGLKFRRQFVMDGFIFDFYCMKYKLVIEIDGNIHNQQKEYDKARETYFREKGLNFIRIKNEELIKNPQIILVKIDEFLGLD